ncbi:MAG TPA: zinc-domain-containing protein [Candidatus Nitrosopolaris sp.]|nr:zinc-domain-containing protein [Candidatus Nitrosopolaris sp.]
MALGAKCPKCASRANLDDDIKEVKCNHCGFHALYDEYIEIMKGIAAVMGEDFQAKSDRRPF